MYTHVLTRKRARRLTHSYLYFLNLVDIVDISQVLNVQGTGALACDFM